MDTRAYRSRTSLGFFVRTLLAVAVVLGAQHAAWATHFRYGNITWKHLGGAGSKTIEFTVQDAWRRDAYTTSNQRCVNPAGAGVPSVACTGAGGAAGLGDVFFEAQGGTKFDFGDGSAQVGSPNGPLLYLVTSVDQVNNWVFAVALNPNSLPAVDTTIEHTYSFTGATKKFTAKISDCCRISPCTAPNAHMNNPDDNFIVQTSVLVGSGDSSPVSSLPPIISCPQNGICTFQVPVSDNELDQVTFRLSTPAEAGFTSQPGSPQCPHAASIDSTTGVYSWDTTGCRLAGSATPQPPSGGCGAANAGYNTLYSTQVMLEEPAKGTKTAIDFFIQLVPTCLLNNSPVFDGATPPCGSTVSAHPNTVVSFPVQASDSNVGDSVSLNAAGVPGGASMSPTLPRSGNPVSSTLSWTPGASDLGQHSVTFTATDGCGAQALCSITIDVSQEICNDGIDNDGDGLIDCFDPDCAGTPCNDGNACTTNDTCSGGPSGCVAGTATNCNDGNVCTTDGCNPGSGCTHTNNSDACNDGDVCTTNDTCGGGTCHGGLAVDCDDLNGCTTDSCDSTLGCQHAVVPGCQGCNSDADCDNHNACDGRETCVAGNCEAGIAPDCDDHNVCTTDVCDTGSGCINAPNTNPCDDGSACTTADVCSGGSCVGHPVNCNDGNVCTDDTCDQLLGCQNVDNTAPCDDDNACTTHDTCQGGSCVGGAAPNCDDANVCTDDTCSTEFGCQHANNTASCDDGKACTQTDTCQNGTCTGTNPVTCTADQCNSAACVEPTGSCVRTPKIDGLACDSGNVCSIDDTCHNGMCVSGAISGDTDGDGYCDMQEVRAQCNPDDPQEIPPQANVYAGGRITSPGEILLTFNAPADVKVTPVGDASCATLGACNPITHFCTAGKIADPCTTAADCNQPDQPDGKWCRVVINYAAVPGLLLKKATFKLKWHKAVDVSQTLFSPVTPGCSRKLDLFLPTGFKQAVLRLQAKGTTGGRMRRDGDRVRYRE